MEAVLLVVFMVGLISGGSILYGLVNDTPLGAVYGLVPQAFLGAVTPFLDDRVLFYQFLSAWGFGTSSSLLACAIIVALTWRMRKSIKTIG